MIECRASHWAYFLLVCPDSLFCLEFVEITSKIKTCLVAVAVAEAPPPPDEYETDSGDDFSDREDEGIAPVTVSACIGL